MAPPARSPGTSLVGNRDRAGGVGFQEGTQVEIGSSDLSDVPSALLPLLPRPDGWAASGLSLTAAAILAGSAGNRRGRRVLVGGSRSAETSGLLCLILSRSARCIWLDLTADRGMGAGLCAVLEGRVALSRAILSREGGFDRLWRGPCHPDRLIDRPHGLAVVLEALSFAYDVVVMSAPERDDSLLAEVLAGVSDDAVVACATDDETGSADASRRDEACSYAARGAERVGILRPDGQAAWLASGGRVDLN